MKESKLLVSILSVVFTAALSLIVVKPAMAAETYIEISAPDGGGCTSVGKWNALTKTCKLTEDIDLSSNTDYLNAITITSDGITLLCNGHSITGGVYSADGILAGGVSGVTIKLCNVKNFGVGIHLNGFNQGQPTSNNTIKNNVVEGSHVGIAIDYSDSNTVKNNTANNNTNSAGTIAVGIALFQANFNTLNDNAADSNVIGIFLQDSDYNILNNNTADSNFLGIILFDADSNILNNNTANLNIYDGILLTTEFDGSNTNTVKNNTADGNTFYGFLNDTTSTSNTYNHNECSDNGSGGSDPSGVMGLCSPQP
jgi:parallel beta-helix repeat protein